MVCVRKHFTVDKDGFFGTLYEPEINFYPGKVLIVFGGSEGRFSLTCMLAEKFCDSGITALAYAYINEEGLPYEFREVPIDTLETAVKRMKKDGYRNVGLWGISMGAELALLAGALMPDLVSCVVAVSPISIATQGFGENRGIYINQCSAFGWRGKGLYYTPSKFKKYPMGIFIKKLLINHDIYMKEMYQPLIGSPDEKTVIPVEKINGPILFISGKQDTMWPSSQSAEYMMGRLKEKQFKYPYKHLSYEYGSHLMIPVQLKICGFFKAERKHKEECAAAKDDSFCKTLEFLKNW